MYVYPYIFTLMYMHAHITGHHIIDQVSDWPVLPRRVPSEATRA